MDGLSTVISSIDTLYGCEAKIDGASGRLFQLMVSSF